MTITAADVKKLRDMTGSGMMDCKAALEQSGGDVEKARTILREKGLADAQKRKGRVASEGIVYAYLHAPMPGIPAKVGAMVEVNCETDFVAKTDDFKQLAHDLALHVIVKKPVYMTGEEVSEEELAPELELAGKRVEGKPEEVVKKAVDGAARKYIAGVALLEQSWYEDEKQTVRQVFDGMASKMGENISIRRFTLFQIGVE